MIQTKGVCKIYRQKKGVPVVALNDVDLVFPEKGMVFLLGKSGSGKSTLLNVLGGLDRYDKGEVIIKGQSSKQFKQKDFDSYRNTYVGFIFQEYNLLDELTVGANIGLAIQLQGRKPTEAEINDILERVDLAGYGDRRPNQLSGGQLQRVAIARALVKKPEIIMADEPTGALDSVTGKQILNTLKKLSEEKLVIVVSHDRDFAERYGDRIIELSDGKVVSDVTARAEGFDSSVKTEGGYAFCDNSVKIDRGYRLTEQDLNAINEYMERYYAEEADFAASRFAETEKARITKGDGGAFKLIPSKLPLPYAFKFGASALKFKKIRLVVTIFLSCVAFVLFGLSATFGSYDYLDCMSESIADTGVNYASLVCLRDTGLYDKKENDSIFMLFSGVRLAKTDDKIIDEIRQRFGIEMGGVYCPKDQELNLEANIGPELNFLQSNIYNPKSCGYLEISPEFIESMGCTILAGRLPEGSENQVAISKYFFDMFALSKYTDGEEVTDIFGRSSVKYHDVKAYDDIIGKTLSLGGHKYTVTAVIDTNSNLSRYEPLAKLPGDLNNTETLSRYMMESQLADDRDYSPMTAMMVGKGHIASLTANTSDMINFEPEYPGLVSFEGAKNSEGGDVSIAVNRAYNLTPDLAKKILWLDGPKEMLADDEIIVSTSLLTRMMKERDSSYRDDGTADQVENARRYGKITFGIDLSFNGYGEDPAEYRIAGIIETSAAEGEEGGESVVLPREVYDGLLGIDGGKYTHIIGPMPKTAAKIKELLTFAMETRQAEEDYRSHVLRIAEQKLNDPGFTARDEITYEMRNPVAAQLDGTDGLMKSLAKGSMYVGVFFAVFAAVMLGNFIATSVSYKRKEIGILRAIGARSNDVVRIFLAESLIIALMNFVISTVVTHLIINAVNNYIRTDVGILVTFLNFGAEQVFFILAISIGVAFVASALPVRKIAAKKPIDAIRDR